MTAVRTATEPATAERRSLERRGRWWLAVSFLFCPCHLPLTLGLLATVFGGTAIGALLRDHGWLAAIVIGLTWLAGTARGLLWIRRAERGELTCALPATEALPVPESRATQALPVSEGGATEALPVPESGATEALPASEGGATQARPVPGDR